MIGAGFFLTSSSSDELSSSPLLDEGSGAFLAGGAFFVCYALLSPYAGYLALTTACFLVEGPARSGESDSLSYSPLLDSSPLLTTTGFLAALALLYTVFARVIG